MPLIHEKNAHFSFAGLKSAVANIVAKNRAQKNLKKTCQRHFKNYK